MYVTRPLSMYRRDPSELLVPPPKGPNSGYLVITDDESEEDAMCCCTGCDIQRYRKLPFPQNKILTLSHSSSSSEGGNFLLIPVLDEPLFSNRYYVIRVDGLYQGQVCRCSREDDMLNNCFNNVIQDVRPKPFDCRDIYQQMEICNDSSGTFHAKSVASDGFPPSFLRRRGWPVDSYSPCLQLGEAQGLNSSPRTHLPEFNFPISNKRSAPSIVGKWYCPFIFVREGSLYSQINNSLFYQITLEQYWEEIYACENNDGDEGNSVIVNASVQREGYYIGGKEAAKSDGNGDDGFIWFRIQNQDSGRGRGVSSVGLSLAIVERMRWVQEEGGWVDGEERSVRVEKVEEITSESKWRRFGCYVLVESFVLKRMDGSLLLNCDFKHTLEIKSKWE